MKIIITFDEEFSFATPMGCHNVSVVFAIQHHNSAHNTQGVGQSAKRDELFVYTGQQNCKNEIDGRLAWPTDSTNQ